MIPSDVPDARGWWLQVGGWLFYIRDHLSCSGESCHHDFLIGLMFYYDIELFLVVALVSSAQRWNPANWSWRETTNAVQLP